MSFESANELPWVEEELENPGFSRGFRPRRAARPEAFLEETPILTRLPGGHQWFWAALLEINQDLCFAKTL